MLDRMDWDTYWRWELFRRKSDPVDFRRYKRDSQRELRNLYRGQGELLLLDSTCGLGDHTVNLAEEGFRVEACDCSPLALDATRRATAEAGLAVEIFSARWEDLGKLKPARYDLIFNDALHSVYDPEDLHKLLCGLRGALRPGGALVFFFADQAEPEEGAGLRILNYDWERMPRTQIAFSHRYMDLSVTLIVANDKGKDYIDQHLFFLIQENKQKPRLETMTMRRVYRWDWYAISKALSLAGFEELRSDHFVNTEKGYTFSLNRAFRSS